MKHHYDSKEKTIQLALLNSKTKTIAEEKQLNSAAGTKQLNRRNFSSTAGENNSTRQQERNNSTLRHRRPPLQQNRLFLSTAMVLFRKVSWSNTCGLVRGYDGFEIESSPQTTAVPRNEGGRYCTALAPPPDLEVEGPD
ncbi:hypothetical protein TNCV_3804551 [Trichonephila clavipes]|nr:hypothetical protein TNCV_3804551 [Trichonephila clavipes]